MVYSGLFSLCLTPRLFGFSSVCVSLACELVATLHHHVVTCQKEKERRQKKKKTKKTEKTDEDEKADKAATPYPRQESDSESTEIRYNN